MQELGSLTGLRYYYSMALEAFDFLTPLLERLFGRFGDAGDACMSKILAPFHFHSAHTEPRPSSSQRLECPEACHGVSWWQGAEVLACIVDGGLTSIVPSALQPRFDLTSNLRDISCAVSWLLVRLIGRSLGLIYRGVRESLVPRQRPTLPRRRNHPQWNSS